MKELPKVYEPQQVESSIYEMWMENDCFKATPTPTRSPTRSSCRLPTSRDSSTWGTRSTQRFRIS